MLRRALLATPFLAAPAAAMTGARVVVAGGGVAEIICALGCRDALVGADSTCLFPSALTRLPQLGYLRALSAEGVLSLRPEILLLAHDAGPAPVVAQLAAAAGPRLRQVPRIENEESLSAAIAVVAEALNEQAAGTRLAGTIAEDFRALAAMRPAGPGPRVMLLLGGGNGAPMAAGARTAADAMFRLAGLRNAMTGYDNYRPVSAEAALAANPDWIVAPSHVLDNVGGADALLASPALAMLPAARAKRLYTADSAYMLGFGPRTAHAARDMATAIHTHPLPALPDRPWLHDS
ncbi:hemin ABC transporter substrate-binding protein [Rhodovarius crocodyli]|uniref:Hemin ABC transporter substrate-binding protein n=1 Tax=Rhodovarius crocodyli TaxID=1979269 RepID=A0A437M429_9PROT|nr:ABC transporter substrate-binding protein [Rhodovarius crocodyli]RVT92335.1 hemin ABC transporter substrate-binding protein [Rhodovarius crocodyli]